MDLVVICLTAFAASILTFFSGFGLGTLLTPVFIVFFPVEAAIALTGVVHFFNNIFKLLLTARTADRTVLLRFGVPAVIAAFAGSMLLLQITHLNPLFSYQAFGNTIEVYPVKFIVAVLLIIFASMDLLPYFKKLEFGRDKLPLGGMMSGFFGGLSGNQGAMRSAFLIRAGLSKEAFVGTTVVVSTFVDFTRLSVYFSNLSLSGMGENKMIILAATLSAITGAFIGNKLLKKVTLGFVQKTVAVMLLLLAVALGAGWV
jgi:uncharacterized membrane protein YfcA